MCKELMSHDQKEVYQLLKSDLPSMHVASALRLCGGFKDTVPHPAEMSGDYCADCVNFFTDIRQIFYNSEGAAEDMVKSLICSKAGPLESLCDQLVDQYGDKIFGIIYQQLNPKDICFLLQMCSNQTHAEFIHTVKYILAKRQRSQMTCDLCQSIAKDVQNALRDTALQNDILSALENDVCSLLPGDLPAQCKTYVSQYGPLVFQVLVAELDPKTICQAIGFCNATKMESLLTAVPLGPAVGTVQIIASEPKDRQSSPQCALCEFIMNKLEDMIGENATEKEIVAALEKVCDLLPHTVKTECDSFVSQYGRMVIQLLLQKLAPGVVCRALGLCAGDKPQPVNVEVPVKSGELCVVCEMVLGYIKSALDDPDNEKTIEELLDEVCNIFPASDKGLCDQLVSAYAPAIINLLSQYDDPVKICSGLGMCSSSSSRSQQPAHPLKFQPMMQLQRAKPHMLGTEKCTYGPSYWCASVANAKECGALEHCVKYYHLKVEA